jgi:hypothetical protein
MAGSESRGSIKCKMRRLTIVRSTVSTLSLESDVAGRPCPALLFDIIYCVRAMAPPQRTSFSSTNDHPAPFVKRPALAPMDTALGLTSLDLVVSNRKLRWAGHVRRMDWSRLPRKFLKSWVDAPRCRQQRTGTLLRARPHARAPADRLQHRQGGRAARRLAELGGCRSRPREMAQARSSAAAGACRGGGNEPSLRTSTDGTDSQSLSLSMTSWRPIQLPPPHTWSQRSRVRTAVPYLRRQSRHCAPRATLSQVTLYAMYLYGRHRSRSAKEDIAHPYPAITRREPSPSRPGHI